ncbi:hypothetical protein ES692_04090 [Psychroserpens burtonensis]|uniref:Outer membrane protein beta-barrel domain-containing protein n=1 Tax=Psychroserpens burtonensis TaxID=49278 RepID=A0A5C7BB30_9FLAO|nr:hypothetical protein [Psychroserpens burtonensis]TXE19045.1 hypothetical protein ES692_04090 [Psychroserpens burtonensis]
MSEKKNIDKLFKEQFKNFEATPSDAVWKNIEAKLNTDKRKRRVIPIWWKVAGVAAAVVLMFTVANTLFNDSDSAVEKEIVDTEKSNNNSISSDTQTDGSELNTSEDLENNPIVENEQNSEEKSKDNNTLQNNLTTSEKSDNKTSVTISEEKEKQENDNNNNSNETHKNKSIIKNKSLQSDAVVSNKKNKLENDKTNNNSNLENKNTVVENSNNTISPNENLKNDIKKEQSGIDTLIKQTKNENTTQVTSSNTLEKENSEIRIDSSKAKGTETIENAIDKAIALTKNEDTEKIKDSINPLVKRWSVAPNMAPVYFNTLGTGSSIDEQFVDNTKEGDVNISYGIKGAYAINKKVTIRAGVNKVNLGYSTNNVVAFTGPNTSASSRELQNINMSDSTTTYLSANNLRFANGPEVLFLKEQGSISQQLGFIEVPIELEYNVLDTKIGLNLIGGFSTLFLSDNDVYSVENNGDKTRLGEATNINDMSYSANFGIGINYNISKQLRFNLEPTFKYQINTFNDAAGNFQPFFIGVYTGLSFKF